MEKYRSYKNGITLYRKSKKDICEICKSTKNLIVHHKDGNRQNNKLNNLKTLCRSCHTKGHKVFLNFKEAYKKEARNSKGRFGTEKPISRIICHNPKCRKITTKDNPRQKYCKKCSIKLDVGHKGRKRYG